MTILTISTVGSGEVHPLTGPGHIFASFVIVQFVHRAVLQKTEDRFQLDISEKNAAFNLFSFPTIGLISHFSDDNSKKN
ncbi:MAG: hypothetical protein VYC91_00715 [Acidobacteriota bacterium]|nr:hypothetical protein [Acidobacteriota bacterium]